MSRRLSTQIFFYFLIVIVLSLSTVGIVSYWQSSRKLDEQMKRSISRIIDSAAYQTDLYLQTYQRASDSILYSTDYISAHDVRHFVDFDPSDSYDYYQFLTQIQKNVLHPAFVQYPQLSLIYMIGQHGRAIADDNSSQAYSANFDPVQQLQELTKLTSDNGSITILRRSVVSSEANDVITMARKIMSMTNYAPAGVLAIEFKTQELAKLWGHLDVGMGGFFFIVDEKGNVIYKPDRVKWDGPDGDKLIRQTLDHVNQTFSTSLNGEPRMFVSRHSDYSGWNLVYSVPVSELRKPTTTIRTTTLTVGFVTLLIAVWLAVRFGRSIITPIRMLRLSMRETEKGNWRRIEGPIRQDEIGGLVKSYNQMVTRLSEMINKVYEAELTNQKAALALQESTLERQKAEFQALQLQINPHFLYNTLEAINCYAIVQDSEEISEIVEAMAFMLRYSIQTNLEEITVANELNHVRNYLIILKHRIEREFEIEVAVPPELLLDKMVRLTLQPLVENCFQHAFPRGIEPHHFIRIDARIEGERFLVSVEDNGAVIPPARLTELRERLRENRLAHDGSDNMYHRGGIGLMNVHRRIQLVFGEEYGVTVDSNGVQGTVITMIMPIDQKRRKRLGEIKPQ